MSDPQRQILLQRLEGSASTWKRSARFYDRIRWATKIGKVVGALLTAFGAVTTAVTELRFAPWLTAGAGIVTAVIEVIGSEFKADQMRAHYHHYAQRVCQLQDRVTLARVLAADDIDNLLSEFHRIENEEAAHRPSFASQPPAQRQGL